MKRDMNGAAGVRGFSLIELLVVILIIALIVAIVLPALSGVRAKSREMATRNLMQNVSQAIAAFQLDNKRLPGRFAERDLGLQATTRGFTSMDNALLELSGGEVNPGPTPPPPGGSFRVGPYAQANLNIMFHPDAVGKNKYFAPPPQHYKLQDGSDVGLKSGVSDGIANNLGVKSLVDADGMPIIAWMSDPATIGPINNHDDMVRLAPTPTASSRFYYNSNYAYLGSNRLGKKGVDQENLSLVGSGSTNRATTMAAILGAPGSPKDITQPCATIFPTAARGSFVLHAAGRNGVFLGNEERGAAAAATTPGNNLFYGMNFKKYPNTPLQDDQGRATSDDIKDGFDDIIVAGN